MRAPPTSRIGLVLHQDVALSVPPGGRIDAARAPEQVR